MREDCAYLFTISAGAPLTVVITAFRYCACVRHVFGVDNAYFFRVYSEERAAPRWRNKLDAAPIQTGCCIFLVVHGRGTSAW